MQTSAPDEQTAQKYLLTLLGRQLFHEPEVFPAISSVDLFENGLPLELEIGCGTGEFLCSLAKQHPTTNFVGVDLQTKSLHRAIETASPLSLDNIKFLRADFILFDPLLIPESLHTVYLHFPDPHVQPKHHKRRIFSKRFLDQMQRALVPGGRLSVMTDHEAYFLEMLRLAEHDARFEKTHKDRYLVGFEPNVKSRYQRIWEGYGLPTLRFELRKHTGEGDETWVATDD